MADPRIPSLSVLVVDDSRVVIKQMQRMLEQAGITKVDCAANASEASEKIGTKAYDVLFLDWYMGGKSGVALMEQYREDRAFDLVAFVIVSGESGKRFIDEAMKAGATSYIVKPFDQDTLQKQLDKIISWLEQRGRFTAQAGTADSPVKL